VPLIAAEDTRLSRRLLVKHGIETRVISYHARSGPGREAELLEHLARGEDLALVTDAGTPGISDPGGSLVAAWAAGGGTVVPIPGASAVLAAIVGSGVAGPRWSFEGFLPRSGRERRERLARIATDERASVVYEAPGRVAATLRDLAAACGADRPAAVCRELTKRFEEVARGLPAELAARYAGPPKGEITLVVGAGAEADRAAEPGAALGAVVELVAAGVSRRQAADVVARLARVSRNTLYAESLKNR
jgi:16S rRNA (cytidine1402-2'-O)-methyltransferase